MFRLGHHACIVFVVSLAVSTLLTVPEGHALDPVPAPSAPGHVDLQTQIKATAAKVTPAVVNIASTVVIRDQTVFDEGPLFGTLPQQPAPLRQYGQGSGVIV